MQCRSQTKRAIKCSGAYTNFEGQGDTYLMNGGEPPVEFTSIAHRNQQNLPWKQPKRLACTELKAMYLTNCAQRQHYDYSKS
ncbi:hypothetical protein [Priestia megaterium]|uniref:hypothetical protein n=1 Tax=Priestia megaterium TaxID=1404 RepID=UPI00211D6494|nr:hypothetical protein [Priestia megaterium]